MENTMEKEFFDGMMVGIIVANGKILFSMDLVPNTEQMDRQGIEANGLSSDLSMTMDYP